MEGRMEEKLQMVGTIGTVRQSMKVLACRPKIFLGLTIALIVPLYVVLLRVGLLMKPMVVRLILFTLFVPSNIHILVDFFNFIDFFVALMSLISTSAIVYTVASSYASDISEIPFHRLLFAVIPRICKRLSITFLLGILLLFFYCLFFYQVIFRAYRFLFLQFIESHVFKWVALVSFMLGLIYVDRVWHLAIVVAVLEADAYGFAAIKKGLRLIKGRMVMAYGLCCMYYGIWYGIGFGFYVLEIRMGSRREWRIAIEAATILSLAMAYLMDLIVKTVFYMAYKAYHKESIDKLRLSEHLARYAGEYLPLQGGSPTIQLEEQSLNV